MAEDILSRFAEVWPPPKAEMEARDICGRLWGDSPPSVRTDWFKSIIEAIHKESLPARTELAPRHRRRSVDSKGCAQETVGYTTFAGLPARVVAPSPRNHEAPQTKTVYFLRREPFRLWLAEQLGVTDNAPIGSDPSRVEAQNHVDEKSLRGECEHLDKFPARGRPVNGTARKKAQSTQFKEQLAELWRNWPTDQGKPDSNALVRRAERERYCDEFDEDAEGEEIRFKDGKSLALKTVRNWLSSDLLFKT